MFKIKPDYDKNRVYITIDGIIDLEGLKAHAEELRIVLKKLKPGFNLINNILEVKSIDEEAREWLYLPMKYSLEAGIGASIRVVPQTLPGETKAMLLDQKSASVGYVSHMVHSIEEAEKLLNKIENEKAI